MAAYPRPTPTRPPSPEPVLRLRPHPRRAGTVEVVGEALSASAAGEGDRPIAARLGRPAATVRGGVRRFTARAELTLQHAMRRLIRFDCGVVRIETDPTATPVQAALVVPGGAAAALERYVAASARARWQPTSTLRSGQLPANTSCPDPPLKRPDTLLARLVKTRLKRRDIAAHTPLPRPGTLTDRRDNLSGSGLAPVCPHTDGVRRAGRRPTQLADVQSTTAHRTPQLIPKSRVAAIPKKRGASQRGACPVSGHGILPSGGHESSPLADSRVPHWRT